MAKYAYPAVITAKDDCFYVSFPDIENCFTDGDTLPESIEMAEDVLALMICRLEDSESPIPRPTDLKALKTDENQTVALVFCDTNEYRREYLGKPVKKTLSIPAWLNTEAERAGVNFSYVLQQALKEHLGINK